MFVQLRGHLNVLMKLPVVECFSVDHDEFYKLPVLHIFMVLVAGLQCDTDVLFLYLHFCASM